MNKQGQNIGVFGIGAIGSVLAFELQRNDLIKKVYHYNRSEKKAIKIVTGNEKFELPIQLKTRPYQDNNLDWLFVCLKEYQYSDAIESISRLVKPSTKVAAIRNGLRLKDPFLNMTDETNVLECSIDCPVQLNKDGFYEVFNEPMITIPQGELAKEFSVLFRNTKVIVKQVADYKTESWKKVCESSALGAVLCLSGETSWVFKDEKIRKLFLDILRENISVAQKDNANIEKEFEDKMLSKLLDYPDNKGSSMLTDRLSGNPIELGAKNKIIAEIGRLNGINTPLNDFIVTLLEKTNKKPAGNTVYSK